MKFYLCTNPAEINNKFAESNKISSLINRSKHIELPGESWACPLEKVLVLF